MAQTNITDQVRTAGFTAAADLSAKENYIVKFGTTADTVNLAGAGDVPLGILSNSPTSGAAASVIVFGGAFAVAGGTISQGDPIKANASGQAVVATSPNDYVIGRAMESAVVNQVFSVFVQPCDTSGAAFSGIGSVAGTGVTAVSSDSGISRITITFEDVDIALTDNAGTIAYGGLKFFDASEGLFQILGAVADLAITKSSAGVNDDWDGDFGVGTVTASNNATLSTTEQNIIPTTATPQAVSGATTATGVSTAVVVLDGTTTATDLFLNFLVDDADHDVTSTPCNLIVNGTITLTAVNLGDK